MGAQLLQSHWPMAFSIKVCQAQRDCAQMEEELLAVLLRMELSYQFTFCHRMDVSANHNPPGSTMEERQLSFQTDLNYVSEPLVL